MPSAGSIATADTTTTSTATKSTTAANAVVRSDRAPPLPAYRYIKYTGEWVRLPGPGTFAPCTDNSGAQWAWDCLGKRERALEPKAATTGMDRLARIVAEAQQPRPEHASRSQELPQAGVTLDKSVDGTGTGALSLADEQGRLRDEILAKMQARRESALAESTRAIETPTRAVNPGGETWRSDARQIHTGTPRELCQQEACLVPSEDLPARPLRASSSVASVSALFGRIRPRGLHAVCGDKQSLPVDIARAARRAPTEWARALSLCQLLGACTPLDCAARAGNLDESMLETLARDGAATGVWRARLRDPRAPQRTALRSAQMALAAAKVDRAEAMASLTGIGTNTAAAAAAAVAEVKTPLVGVILFLCMRCGANLDVAQRECTLRALLAAAPPEQAAQLRRERDVDGRTALHLLALNPTVDVRALRVLGAQAGESSLWGLRDAHGYTPLDYLGLCRRLNCELVREVVRWHPTVAEMELWHRHAHEPWRQGKILNAALCSSLSTPTSMRDYAHNEVDAAWLSKLATTQIDLEMRYASVLVPRGKLHLGCDNGSGRAPVRATLLHVLCTVPLVDAKQATDAIKTLLRAYGAGATAIDSEGSLAIHCLAANVHAAASMFQAFHTHAYEISRCDTDSLLCNPAVSTLDLMKTRPERGAIMQHGTWDAARRGRGQWPQMTDDYNVVEFVPLADGLAPPALRGHLPLPAAHEHRARRPGAKSKNLGRVARREKISRCWVRILTRLRHLHRRLFVRRLRAELDILAPRHRYCKSSAGVLRPLHRSQLTQLSLAQRRGRAAASRSGARQYARVVAEQRKVTTGRHYRPKVVRQDRRSERWSQQPPPSWASFFEDVRAPVWEGVAETCFSSRNIDWCALDANGQTPLHVLVKSLAQRGRKLQAQDKACLLCAASGPSSEAFEIADKSGNTATQLLQQQLPEVLRLLCEE